MKALEGEMDKLFKIMKIGTILFIIVALILLVSGKAFFSNSANVVLLIYGAGVTTVVLFTYLISLRYKDLSLEPFLKHTKMPFVSCVLAVRNEKDIIEMCIDSLVNSYYRNKEIIVVNDASTDNTKNILKKYEGHPFVTVLTLPKNVGKKKAICEGLKIARGEIFVFTDSDCRIAPDAIGKIIKIMVQHPTVGAVSGHGRALNARENILTKAQDTWYETQYSVKKAFESVYGAVCCVSGPLAVFRRSAIFNYIPAWENDTFLGQEFKFATDRQLTGYVLGSKYVGQQLKEQYKDSYFVTSKDYTPFDWKVVYCKSAKVWTVVPNTMKKLLRQHIRWKKSFIRNMFFTGTFYWRKNTIAAARFYLGALFIIVGPLVAIRHLIYLPLQGNILAAVYYIGGIVFLGFIYGIIFKLEDPKSELWIYRPVMSLISTLILSWLIFYSLVTIKKMVWHRG